MKRQNMFDVANPVGFDRIEIGAGFQSLVYIFGIFLFNFIY